VGAAVVTEVMARHGHDPARLVQILREVQELAGWLCPEALGSIAAGLGRTRAEVSATVEFYSFLHAHPPGDYRILFSDNITDRMLGSADLMRALCEALLLEPGRVSADGLVSVGTTSCTGLCDQGPAVLVNQVALTGMTPERIAHMAELVRERIRPAEWPDEWRHVEDNIRRRDVLLGHALAPGQAIAAALDRGAGPLLAEIERSGLRGRGGAGFPTPVKWRACRAASGAAHYVICNADEGEPGTFKDRVLLSSQFDLVVDGLCVAALAVGAQRGFIYLRGEYRYLLDRLEARLQQRREQGLLGDNILGRGFAFDIDIHLGAGAYICGEESALIESMEGKPGKPRIRPPFPVSSGYLGQPTVVNNVETLALACLIAVYGGEWFSGIGTPGSAGTKLLSVSGDVRWPGTYEYPLGVPLAEVLCDAGACNTQAVTTAGAAGPCLGADAFDRRIAFDDLATGGSIMVFDQRRDMLEVALNFAEFFAHESCGFCTPCRVGTAINRRLVRKLAAGLGSAEDVRQIRRVHDLMHGASHCGLGNTASIAITDILSTFAPTIERRLRASGFEPAFDLDAALSQARRVTGRDDPAAHLSDNRSASAGHDGQGTTP
jgi:[NiFe] hydrogenase diaphorase moiety large subunit